MSTIFHLRRRTQRQINWPLYREHRAHLADLFPAISYSGGEKQPLAVGIKYDLIGANTGLTARDVKHFLRAYCFGPKYLRMLKRGARRIALDGTVAGWVSDEEAAHAALELRTHYEMRRAGVTAEASYPIDAVQPFVEAA
jgi:sRNA-binding protein